MNYLIEYYRNFAPGLCSSSVIGGCVTMEQLIIRALSFKNVVDCKLLGQKDTFPTNLRYLNMVQTTILITTGLITKQEWTEFVQYMKEKTNLEFIKVDPESINIDVNVVEYIDKTIISDVLQARIEQAFKDYFTQKIGYIGLNFYLSHIVKILRTVLGNQELKRYTIIFPTEDKEILKTQYLILRNLNVTIIGVGD